MLLYLHLKMYMCTIVVMYMCIVAFFYYAIVLILYLLYSGQEEDDLPETSVQE